MTIAADDVVRFSFVGNGVTTSFPITSKFFANGDLRVWVVDDEANPPLAPMTLNTDYTVAGAGESAGGTVEMTDAPANGSLVTVLIAPPIEQLADYEDADDFPASAHESSMDKLARIIQRHEDILTNLVPKLPEWMDADDLPDVADLLIAADLADRCEAAAAAIGATPGHMDITLVDSSAAFNGPNLNLYRDSVTPADFDGLGGVNWYGRNDGGDWIVYGSIIGQIYDTTAGTEDGALVIKSYLAGALVDSLVIKGFTEAKGRTDGSDPTAGYVGEVKSSAVLFGAASALTTNTALTVTSIALTPGDWDVDGHIAFLPAVTTSITVLAGGISQTTNAMPAAGLTNESVYRRQMAAQVPNSGFQSFPIPRARISVTVNTTVYLVALGVFTVSTLSGYGAIQARRVS